MRRWPKGCRQVWSEEDIDPLLSTLTSLRNRRLQLEADMRLLIAYGRCFTHPRPYKLIDLANAAGMSISGIRTAYDTDEIDQAAEILQRPPTAPPQSSRRPVTASITTGRRSLLPASWRVLADGPRRNEGDPQGLPERPAAEPGPGRIELQLATAGYSTGSCAELTPGQARAVASALPGLAGSAARAGAGWTHALPAGCACCGGAAPRFR